MAGGWEVQPITCLAFRNSSRWGPSRPRGHRHHEEIPAKVKGRLGLDRGRKVTVEPFDPSTPCCQLEQRPLHLPQQGLVSTAQRPPPCLQPSPARGCLAPTGRNSPIPWKPPHPIFGPSVSWNYSSGRGAAHWRTMMPSVSSASLTMNLWGRGSLWTQHPASHLPSLLRN